MERLRKKQLELLRMEKEERQQQQKVALKSLIKNQQSYQIIIKYAEQYLKGNKIDKLSQYSPIQISRLIFNNQLEKIRTQFQKLPNKQVLIQHFILILTKIMKFPFQKTPLYMVGLKDMFYQIVKQGKQSFEYNDFFKYILGQFVTMKEEQQNTEFQVQIIERKKQDYLLHDNGIKRIYYSKDMKIILSLDQRSNAIKIYDQDMKNINKFSPKKEKHNNKFPTILDFDYSEITQKLGLILSDQTLSTVQLSNFLQKSNTEFQNLSTNQLVYSLPQKMKFIFFIQMMNKWLTVSEEESRLYLFDMQRIRSQPEKIMNKLKIDLNDQKFSSILEIVSLSCICVIAGNQVSFYNQNFSQLRFKKFTHCQEIKHFKFSDQKNQFYLCGEQKSITIFSINRSGYPSKIHTFPTSKIVMDFQIFPYFDTIVIADQNNDLKLIHQSTRMIYHQINYGHIVKSKDKSINIYKISKNQLAIYQTYLLVMSQQKIAIQRDIEYSFLPYHYFDNQKEELYLSVNNQIISFSLLSGEIRKNYSFDSSNTQKHHSFFTGNHCPLFILDHQFNIYQVYQKDQLLQGQYKHYRKKINIEQVLNCFYDSSLSTMIIVSKRCINQIRNDKNNNFNLINTINLQGFHPITMSDFCQKSKTITLLTSDQLVYQFKNYEYSVDNCFRFIFPKDLIQHEEKIISKIHFDSHYNLFIILNNNNQLYCVDRITHQQLYFNLTHHMPAKLKKLKFNSFSYQLINQKKGIFDPYILILDDSGFIVQFSLKKIFQQFKFTVKTEDMGLKPMFKQTQAMTNQNIVIQQICLSQVNTLKRSYEEIGLMKAHEKIIVLALKLKIQILTTLTISKDGYIRLWNSNYKLLFSLKIPSLTRISWNMEQIQEIKNRKSIEELLTIFKNNYYPLFHQHQSPVQVYNKSKKLKKVAAEIQKINISNPIKLQIENKDIEEIVMQNPDYTTFYGGKDKARTASFFHTTSKIYAHPWRKNKQLLNIFNKASCPTKYNSKIPNHLIQLRNSLDMTERVKEKANYKEAERLLPQLSFYQPQKFLSQRKPDEIIENEEQVENFESCLYVKKQKKKKKINELDQIDKQFKKKEMMLTARKWVPKKRSQRNRSTVQLKSQVIALNSQKKVDPLKAIGRIFQQHNKECMQTKKGRIIRVPKINLQKDIF